MRGSSLAVCVGIGAMTALMPIGCSTPPKNSLAEWSESIAALGLVEVRPVSEDIRVGDLFASPINPELGPDANLLSRSTRWGGLEVLPALAAEYANRPSLPKTPTEYSIDEVTADQEDWPEATMTPSIFTPATVTDRLRTVGIGAFRSFTFTGSDLEALIPNEAATLITGDADADDLAISIRVASAEGYALSLVELLSAIVDEVDTGNVTRYYLKEAYQRNLAFAADPATGRTWIRVVSEVVYVRSADISVRNKNATPTDDNQNVKALVKTLDSTSTNQPASTPPTQAAPGPPATGQPAAAQPAAAQPAEAQSDDDEPGWRAKALASAADPIYGSYTRAARINEVLRKMDADEVPTGLVRFVSVTDESISLRRVWRRPLAVAVRGLTLEVNSATGEVVNWSAMGSPMPVRAAAPTSSSASAQPAPANGDASGN